MRKSHRKITYIPDTGDLDTAYCSGGELMDATKAVVSTLSRKSKTTVSFAGDGAYTDGENVVLPALPTNATITKRQGLVTGGYANHETLHNLLTEFGGETEAMCRQWHIDGRKFTSSLANAMEDVRIEMGGRDLYNGLPKAIDHTAHVVNQKFLDNHATDDQYKQAVNDFAQIAPVAITWEGRRRLGYPSDTMQKCLDLLPADILKKVNIIVDAVQTLPTGVTGMGDVDQQAAYRGCRQLHKLAERIADDYQREQTNSGNNGQPPSNNDKTVGGGGSATNSQDNGDAQREGDQGTSGGTTVPDATSPVGDGGQGSGEGQRDQKSQDPTSGDQGVATTSEVSGNDKHTSYDQACDSAIDTTWEANNCKPAIDGDLTRAIEDVTSEIMKQKIEGGRHLVFCKDADYWLTSQKDKTKFNGMQATRSTRLVGGESEYARRLKGMGNKLGTMRRKLERALSSQKRSRYEPRKKHGKLDTGKLTNIVRFDPNVFRHKVIDDHVNTAVSVCVDLSGSMGGAEVSLATDCCIAIGEALQGTGVALEITGHNTAGRSKGVFKDSGVRRYNRKSSIRMVMFKPFDQPLQRSRGAIGKMPNSTGATNADGDAWMYSADRLLDRPEQRKVMMILADGRPNYSNDYGSGDCYKHTRNVVEWLGLNGIDTVGIGIGDDCVKQFFPRYVVVQDIDDLSKHVMDQLGKMLLGERFHVDNSDLISSSVRDARNAR